MDTAAIARLVGEENVTKTVDGFEAAIAASFRACPARMTRSAVKERVDVCVRLVQRLRNDLDWSLPKVLDHLTTYLQYELDGVPYTPTASTIWAPPSPRLALPA